MWFLGVQMTVLTHHLLPQHSVTLHPELQEFCPKLQQAFSGWQTPLSQVGAFPIYKLCLPGRSADSSTAVYAVLCRCEAAQVPSMPWGDEMGWQEVEAASTSQALGCRILTHLVGQCFLYNEL